MNRYAKGRFFVLAIPDNIGDLYSLPRALVTEIKSYIAASLPVRLDAPSHVSLFIYDNDTFVVRSFRDEPTGVNIDVSGEALRLRDLTDDHGSSEPAINPTGGISAARRGNGTARFSVQIEPHSYRVYRIERQTEAESPLLTKSN